jgi:hypothetical protein
VLNGVTEREDTTLGLCLITHVGVLLTHTNHDTALCQYFIFWGARTIWRSDFFFTAQKNSDRGDDLPMVTGTTDNGGYRNCQFSIPCFIPKPKEGVIRRKGRRLALAG